MRRFVGFENAWKRRLYVLGMGQMPECMERQYTRGDNGYSRIMLEVVVSYNMWIWHASFDNSGSNNDLNVLNSSLLFDDMPNDTTHVALFYVNGVDYKKGYHQTDGIDPSWAMFIKSFLSVVYAKRLKFRSTRACTKGCWAAIWCPTRLFAYTTTTGKGLQCKRYTKSCLLALYCIIWLWKKMIFFIVDAEEYYVNLSTNMQRTKIERCDEY